MSLLVRRAVTAVVVAGALAGCGGPVRSGAAAVVGDTRIPTEQLAELVDAGLADPAAGEQLGSDRSAYQRDVLSRLIQARLVEEAARRRGVTVTQGEADREYAAIRDSLGGEEQLRAQAAAAGLSLDQVRGLARTRALSNALGDALTRDVQVPREALEQAYRGAQDRYDQVRTAHVQVADLAAARRLLPEARRLDAAGFAELARTRSQDESTRERGGDTGLQPRSAFAGAGLTEYAEQAFRADAGDTFAVRGPQGAYVVRVLERRTVPLAEAEPELRRQLLAEQREGAVRDLLATTARDLDIAVNPRFGEWSDDELAVLERTTSRERQFSTPVPRSDAEPPALAPDAADAGPPDGDPAQPAR